MSEESLQDRLDRLKDGDTLTLKPTDEAKGPVVLRKAVAIVGAGATIWAARGPVVRIESGGVVLRHLNVEVTGREADLEGEAACALVVRPGVSVSLEDVTVRGDVIGLDREEGVWRHPRTLSLGTLKAGTAHEFAVMLSIPTRCVVECDIDGLHVQPREIQGEPVKMTLRLDALAAGTRVRGRLTLRSAYLTRRITVNALAAEGATNVGHGQVVWAPEGVVDTSPPPPNPPPTLGEGRVGASPKTIIAGAGGSGLSLPLEPIEERHRSPPTAPSSTPFSPLTTPVSAPVGGGAIVVSPDEGGHFRTIGEAIREARPGTKILVRPGVYAESLVLDRRVEIVGDGSAADIVVESQDGNCLRMQTDMARVRGLTLLGSARRGGRDRYAVHIPQGRLILEDCRISSDSLACVAVSNAGTAPVLRRCSIRNGRSVGVLVYDRAELVMEECEIGENTLAGVEVRQAGRATLRRCRLDGGRAAGVLVHEKGEAVLEDCELSGHALAGVESRRSGHPVLRRCVIRDGKSVGLRVAEDGLATLEDCEIREHVVYGIEVRQGGNPFLRRCKLHHNKQGGAFFHRDAKGTLEECDVHGSGRTGVEVRQNSDPVLRRCTIHECDESGVAFRDRAKGTLEDCDVYETGLAAVDVRQNSIPVLRRCKVHESRQAGIVVVGRSAGTLEDCDVYGCQGPGVAVSRQANPTLRRCKVHENTLAGVVVWGEGQGTLERCVVSDNGLSGLAVLSGGAPAVRLCTITANADAAVWAARGAAGSVEDCDLAGNRRGPLDLQGGAAVRLQRNRDGSP